MKKYLIAYTRQKAGAEYDGQNITNHNIIAYSHDTQWDAKNNTVDLSCYYSHRFTNNLAIPENGFYNAKYRLQEPFTRKELAVIVWL